MTENPLPHQTGEGCVKESELRAMKLLDRNVRDHLGGLRILWADHGLSRHYFLPPGANPPFTYARCACRRCEWVIGRQPLYASDVVRFYQSRHPEAVVNPIPPPATCEFYDQWPAKPSTGCKCPRCEEGRGSLDDDGENVTSLGFFDLKTLSQHLQSGKAGTVSVLHRPVGAGQGVKHLRFMYPYNRNLYELLGVPKPAQEWEGFGKPCPSKQRTDILKDTQSPRRITID